MVISVRLTSRNNAPELCEGLSPTERLRGAAGIESTLQVRRTRKNAPIQQEVVNLPLE